MDTKINLVLCTTESGGIGLDNKIPWRLPLDMRYFKGLTTGAEWSLNEDEPKRANSVVMGRKTWDSLPNGALPNRKNYVLSNNPKCREAMTLGSIPAFLRWMDFDKEPTTYWIIGGASIYNQFLDPQQYLDVVDHVYLNTGKSLMN